MKNQDLVIVRSFNAPRELVWQAWTEPERCMRWWGPKGFTTPACKIDLRVGGAYLNCMRSPEGQDFWSTGVYREVVRPERIVCTDSFADADGKVVPATHYGMSADFPLELLITVTFAEDGGKTRLTLKHAGLPSGEDFDNCRTGWNESFDKLNEFLAKS
ncbi:MAG: SRPBCC domain-containing protein [Desulfurivibrionaceae bacterium]